MMSVESNSEKLVSYQKKDGRGHPPVGMTTTKTLRPVFSYHHITIILKTYVSDAGFRKHRSTDY